MSMAGLRMHSLQHDDSDPDKQQEEQRKFFCSQCDKTYISKMGLYHHNKKEHVSCHTCTHICHVYVLFCHIYPCTYQVFAGRCRGVEL